MKKGELIEGVCQYVKFPNKGMVETAEGEKCIVKNALPGQKVQVRVQKKRKGHGEGLLLSVLEEAPDAQKVDCPQFGTCGGCLYLSVPYEKVVDIKEDQVKGLLQDALDTTREDLKRLFLEASSDGEEGQDQTGEPSEEGAQYTAAILPDQIPDLDAFWEKAHQSPVRYGYRNKMELTFGDAFKDGPLTLGMHKRGSFYDLTDAGDCVLVDQDYRMIQKLTQEYFQYQGISYFHKFSHSGYLRHLLVRKASHTGEILIDLVTSTQTDTIPSQPGQEDLSGSEREELLLANWKKAILELPFEGRIAGILHTRNDSVADVIQDQGTDILYGHGYFEEELLGLKFIVTPFSFFQTNSYGAELLYTIARDYISGTTTMHGQNKPVVFDLYCGTGTISQLIAPAASRVVGVEIVPEAVDAARENALRNGVKNCDFIAGDVLKVIDTIEEKPDLIILDPPRDGIHPKALPKILGYGVENLLYISCKPTTLARDLPAFLKAGYIPVRGTCVDQFPWTSGVETEVLFTKKTKGI